MKKSIGKKVLGLMLTLGVFLILICLLNLAALSNIEKYNSSMEQSFNKVTEAMASNDAAALEAAQNDYDKVVRESNVRISGTETFNIVLVVLVVLIMVSTIIVVKRTIADPAKNAEKHLSEIVGKIEDNHGDLTERIQTKSTDEIGHLVNGINCFMDQLQEMMRRMVDVSSKIMNSSDEITGSVNESNQSAMNISAVTEELSASMQEISATVEQMTESSNDILSQIRDMNENAKTGSSSAAEIKKHAAAMRDQTVENKKSASEVFSDVGTTLATAVEESRSVDQINSLTANILDISSQTNLLALNASIEAARAGESGKGFAVVADEIRVLADNSRQTASDIKSISEQVTEAVNRLADAASKLLEYVNSDVVRDYDTFVKIADQYEADTDKMDSILSDFAKKSAEMTTAMEAMNRGINDISVTVDESTEGVSGVAEDAAKMAASISHIQRSTEQNQTISQELDDEIKRFERV
ncbi:MAG: methyl-accepting chemotaxis protein [Butyrivibrio sp.]